MRTVCEPAWPVIAVLALIMVVSCTGDEGAQASNTACVATFEFATEARRREFLQSDPEALVAAVKNQTFIVASDGPGLDVVFGAQNCTEAAARSSLPAAAGHRMTSIRSERMEFVNSRLSRVPMYGEVETPRQCVLRSNHSREMFGEFIATLPFTGLRSVQVQYADDVFYFGVDDPCEVALPLIRAIANSNAHIAPCPAATLKECGYPISLRP